MKLNKSILALSILSATLVGCGGSSSSGGGSTTPPEDDLDFVSCEGDVCTLEGVITEDYTLTSDKEWRLGGYTYVGTGGGELTSDADVQAVKDAGVTLTIEPGVEVKAFDTAALLVTRGSKLMAEGTADMPITFSSIADADYDGMGEWGGVIIQGFAPQYGQGGTGACFGTGTVCNVAGEGGDGVGNFGGNDPADDSGVIKYVRIAEGGLVAGPNNEINGLTLQGVGYGTTVEYVQVHNNLDDGVEWFGGTVNAKYLVLTGNDDDDIDFDEGYMGNIQYAIIRKNPALSAPSGSNDPRGIEANSSDSEYVPETAGALANITLIGSEMSNGEPGMRLRGALTASVYNTVVYGWETCVRIDDADTDEDETTGDVDGLEEYSDVTLNNVIGNCGDLESDNYYAKREEDAGSNNGTDSTIAFDAAAALTNASATVTQMDFAEIDNGSGFAFDNTTYIGAVEPGTAAADAWWAGWVIEGSMDGIEDQDPTTAE